MISNTEDCRDFLKLPSSSSWLHSVMNNFNTFLVDHAACERKASATCMSFVVKYPDHKKLIDTMIRLAREELEHFHEVFHLLQQRGLQLGPDIRDEYVNQLMIHCRNGKNERLMDRLILSGIIEARGCERFFMIAKALETSDLRLSKFYLELARSERRHHIFFIDLAAEEFGKETVLKRTDELLNIEASIIESLPHMGILH